LSGGQQQRVAIARALAGAPQCLIMDEPFGAVDVLLRESFANWFDQVVTEKRLSVLFISHDPEEVVHISDRVHIIENGSISDTVRIDLPRPRPIEIRDDPKFRALTRRLKTVVASTSDTLQIRKDPQEGLNND